MRMKKLSYLIVFVVALGLIVFAQPEWTEYSGNPVFGQWIGGPKAYYPSVLYDANAFSAHDASAKYKMWYGTSSGKVGIAYSDDGISWVDGGLVLGNVRYHCKVLYDPDGFGGGSCYYKMWFGDPSIWPYNLQTIKYAESNDGVNWVNVQPISQDPLKPLITGSCGWWYGTYGPGTVLYNPDGYEVWNDSDPVGHKYVMYYDTATMNCIPGETESTALAYSLDGVYWRRYGNQPVILSGPDDAWDGEYTYAWTVLKDGDVYHMWYSGSGSDVREITDRPGSHAGIGYATSSDGINWTRDADNPIFHVLDGVDWRDIRTYTPSVLKDGSTYKMWFSGKGSAYSICYATAAPPIIEMASFVVEKAKIDFKKKPDDDKVRVKGKLELDLVNGDGVDISDDVTVTVGPLSETIIMVEKGKKGEKWEYKRPKGGTGDIKKMTIDWKNGKFDIRMDKADLTEVTNPVTISIQIGDDFGTEDVMMKEHKHHWDYH